MGGALRAISARSAADILSALARPPFRPRLRPSVTAPISFNPIVTAASLGFLARRGRRSSGSPLHYVLFALPPVTSRRMPGVISFTPPARDPVER